MEPLKKRVYYRPTTPQQRKLMMRVYQETRSVTKACQAAKVSRSTFYRWHGRFQEQGEAALETLLSRAPHRRPRQIPEELAQRALELKKANPSWGLRSVANRICQEHGYRRVISHEGVSSVWKRQRLASQPPEEGVSKPALVPQEMVQKADRPDKTVNIDLFFLPRQKLLQPEGSLAVEAAAQEGQAAASPGAPSCPAEEGPPRPVQPPQDPVQRADCPEKGKAAAQEGQAVLPPSAPSYPGQAFQREDLSYDEQMHLYAQGRQERQESPKPQKKVSAEEAALQKELEELRIKQEELRQEGRKARKARKEQEQARKAERQQRKKVKQERQKLSRKEKKCLKKLQQQEDEQRKVNQAERRQAVEQQTQQQVQMKEKRQELKKKEAELKGKLSLLTGLVAVLVIVDNCTRRCLGLPVFLEGRNVTADSIVEALKLLLPPELQYLISDNGSQFKAELFQQLALQMGFLHVRISPRRPRTNGIAERLVRTFKGMLLPYSWDDSEEFQQILASLLVEYNDRPHQGKGLNGLSPNELDYRLRETQEKVEQKCAA